MSIVARVHNSGLEGKPDERLGSEPQRDTGGRAAGQGVMGESHPEGCRMEAANLPTFLRFGNAKNHRYFWCLCKTVGLYLCITCSQAGPSRFHIDLSTLASYQMEFYCMMVFHCISYKKMIKHC